MAESFDRAALLDDFRDEARGQVERLDAALLALEESGGLGEEQRTELLRALHTLKGNSGMLDLAAVRDYVHAVEDTFKEPPAEWTQELLDRLFEGAAALRRAIERAGTDDEERAFERLAGLAPEEDAVGTQHAASLPSDSEPEYDEEAPEPTEVGAGTDVLRVPSDKLDTLLNRVGELHGGRGALEEFVDRHGGALEEAGLRRELSERVEALAGVSEGLRTTAMELRLVSVRRVFSRFPSVARDLARERGKRVRVELEGEETELDKSTVDALGGVLVHLVRNAVDHGIERPEERERAGKPPEGTIRLNAEQHGDRVHIEVADDGAGLDRGAIVARARERGVLDEGEEPERSEQVEELLFAPGFSTREEATAVSGRGVGLDVVRERVRRLRGRLDIDEPAGGGTRFVLRLPLTIAVVPALFFESEGEVFAVPGAEIEETVRRPSGAERERVGRTEMVRHRGELVPLARPGRLFGWERGQAEVPNGRFAIIARRNGRGVAVVAERLLDQRDVVVKGLSPYLGEPRGVSGATVAPDGRVVLLLDAGALIDLNLERHREAQDAQ